MLIVRNNIALSEGELSWSAVRAQGAGGQNVNKVSSAMHLRFDIKASSLPEHYRTQLLSFSDDRITKDGVIVIKAQSHRTQEKNKREAIERLLDLIRRATQKQKHRVATRPTLASKKRRLDKKTQRSNVKNLRSKVRDF